MLCTTQLNSQCSTLSQTVKFCNFFSSLIVVGEMVGQICDGCRSWEEDIYWSHFQFLHFVQVLRADYDQHLALSKTFSDNLKKKLPENVTLKGPSGVMWNIGMTTRDDTLYFAHGWEQFVNDHCLKENDFLVFKYNGESQFDVLIFNGWSLCEKAGSYFVRKCGHTEIDHPGGSLNKKRDTDNNSLEEDNIPSNAGVECALHEKSAHVNGTKEPIDVPPETPPSEKTFNAGVEYSGVEEFRPDGGGTLAAVPSETANGKRIRNIVSAVKHVHTKGKGRPAKGHVRERTHDWVAALEAAEPVSASRSGTYEVYKSNRRPVTDDETRKIESLAKAACTDDSIYVVMKPSHVYKRFFVSMRGTWIGKHISLSSQDVILRMGKGEWIARYSYNNIRNNGGLTGGWKHFSLDCNLEEGDACVFKPAGRMNNTFVIDMSIFRVVPDTVPLTLMSPRTRTGTRTGIRRRGRRVRKAATMKSIQTQPSPPW